MADVPVRKETLTSDKISKGSAPLSPGIRCGNVIWVSGQVSFNANQELVGAGDIEAQTRQVLENVKAILEAGGATLENVVKVTVFLTDTAHYHSMNAVYAEYFPSNPPARSCVQTGLARPEFLVEIEAMAVV